MPQGSIVLGGVTLNPSLQWPDRWRYASIAQEQIRTLGGSLVINSARLYEGLAVTLTADTSTGWLTKLQSVAILALADGLTSTYTLDFHGVVMTVAFDHTKSPAVQMRPLLFKEPQEDTDYFIGSIKLITV
jgi:hypothetical protein